MTTNPSWDAAGAAELAGRLRAAFVAAREAAGVFTVCTADPLNEGSNTKPALEMAQWAEAWTSAPMTIEQDLGALAQLYQGVSDELDRGDDSFGKG